MTLEEAMQEIQVGKEYLRYKGEIYDVDFIAADMETGEPMLVCHKIGTKEYFVSTADIWLKTESVPVRFKLIVED